MKLFSLVLFILIFSYSDAYAGRIYLFAEDADIPTGTSTNHCSSDGGGGKLYDETGAYIKCTGTGSDSWANYFTLHALLPVDVPVANPDGPQFTAAKVWATADSAAACKWKIGFRMKMDATYESSSEFFDQWAYSYNQSTSGFLLQEPDPTFTPTPVKVTHPTGVYYCGTPGSSTSSICHNNWMIVRVIRDNSDPLYAGDCFFKMLVLEY